MDRATEWKQWWWMESHSVPFVCFFFRTVVTMRRCSALYDVHALQAGGGEPRPAILGLLLVASYVNPIFHRCKSTLILPE